MYVNVCQFALFVTGTTGMYTCMYIICYVQRDAKLEGGHSWVQGQADA